MSRQAEEEGRPRKTSKWIMGSRTKVLSCPLPFLVGMNVPPKSCCYNMANERWWTDSAIFSWESIFLGMGYYRRKVIRYL